MKWKFQVRLAEDAGRTFLCDAILTIICKKRHVGQGIEKTINLKKALMIVNYYDIITILVT